MDKPRFGGACRFRLWRTVVDAGAVHYTVRPLRAYSSMVRAEDS